MKADAPADLRRTLPETAPDMARSAPRNAGDGAHWQVCIVGAGPTGLILANLLGAHGVRVLLLERQAGTVDEPRAVTIDDESLRTVQATGLIEPVLQHVVQGYGVHYYSWRKRVFARIEPASTEYGYAKRNAFRQQVLVRQLRDGLARHAGVDLRFGHALESFRQDLAGVALTVRSGERTSVLHCDWLVACDGGRSGVREQLGITLEGGSYDEKWLIADLLQRRSAFRHTRTYCDPRRPAIRLPGPDGTLRYEFMLHPGEDPEQMLDEARIRGWIAEREPSDAQLPLARKVVYAFHARIAPRWRVDRVLLAGDAAHLTPPFAGQGMNSGVRDAANLAWKLAAVVQGASPQLLDSYEQERKPHAWWLIRMAVRIGAFMQPKSVFAAALAQAALKLLGLVPVARDYILQLRFKPRPRFAEGFFVPHPVRGAVVPSGQLLPQPWVELKGGCRVRLDDVLGQGFALLHWTDGGGPPTAPTGPGVPVSMRHIGLLRQSDDFIAGSADEVEASATNVVVRDCDGVLASVLDSARARGVVLRPDRYVLAYLPGGAADGESTGLGPALALLATVSMPSLTTPAPSHTAPQAGALHDAI